MPEDPTNPSQYSFPASAPSPSSSPKALYDSEELFRRLVESVQDYAIFLLDATGHVASWNAGAERIKGYSATEILGQHFSRFYTPEDVARGHPDAELQIARRDGRYEEEGWRVRKDGTRFLASVVIAPLTDADGQIQGFSKVTRDITEKKQAEEARLQQESERRSRELLKQILWIVTEGKLNVCSDSAELPPPLPFQSEPILLEAQTLRVVRHSVEQAALQQHLLDERVIDLIIAVGEASMNAVVHGRGGTAQICTDANTDVMDTAGAVDTAGTVGTRGTVQVWIEDQGPGIAMELLHRATLERGFTTVGTLGHGFWMMLQTCDRLWLWSGPAGTTLVLEQDKQNKQDEPGKTVSLPPWLGGSRA